jgi:hypothetical protein
MTASTIPPLSVWPCGTPFGNTQGGPDRLRSATITDPLSRGFGIPNRSPDPLGHAGGAGSKHTSLDVHAFLGWPAGKAGPLPPFRDIGAHDRRSRTCALISRRTMEHDGMCAVIERRDNSLRRLSAPSPLGVTRSSQSRGLASSSSCRVSNCPSQEPICASLQCSCKSQSQGQPPGKGGGGTRGGSDREGEGKDRDLGDERGNCACLYSLSVSNCPCL